MNVTSKTTPAYQLTEAAERAAEQVGVRLYNLRDSGRGIAFTLKTGAPSEWREDWRGPAQAHAQVPAPEPMGAPQHGKGA